MKDSGAGSLAPKLLLAATVTLCSVFRATSSITKESLVPLTSTGIPPSNDTRKLMMFASALLGGHSQLTVISAVIAVSQSTALTAYCRFIGGAGMAAWGMEYEFKL